ncbi:hypothetical protein [Pseudonocardia sp. NPDC049154]|uniref:hypothetical protein n=1 Tax=Pseudonocardia sp. NPDC049154 TaxID=3155501 RepID=UPI003409480B
MSKSGRSTAEESAASGTPASATDEPGVRPAERTTYLRVRPSPRPRTTPAADARDTPAAGAPVQPVDAGEAATAAVEPSEEPAGVPAAVADDAEEPTAPEVEKAGAEEEPTEGRAVADDQAAEVQADEAQADEPGTGDLVAEPSDPAGAAEPDAEAGASRIEPAAQGDEQPDVEEPADEAGVQPEAAQVAAPAGPDEPSDLETTVELAHTDADTGSRPTPAPRPRPFRTVPVSSGPSTKVLQPISSPPAPATIPALPIAPADPADRPFANPQRSVPGKPDTLLRRLFRRRS